jgi:AbrB family looped-hinge helix DNA binding protein
MKIDDTHEEYVKCQVNANGRIVIPAPIRKAMGIQPGDEVVLNVGDGVLHIEAQSARVRRVQASLGRLIPPDRKLSAELIADRREEAKREMEDWIG